MEGRNDTTTVASQKMLIRSQDSFQQDQELFQQQNRAEVVGMMKSELAHNLSYHSIYNHEDFITHNADKSTALVLDVADQIKEKLVVGMNKNCNHHPINGCFLNNRENGLMKLDKFDESGSVAVHCNHSQQTCQELELEKKLLSETNENDYVEGEKNCVTNEEDNDTDKDAYCDLTTTVTDENLNGEAPLLPVLQDNSSSSLISAGRITYVGYESELQMPDIMRLIQKDLSEPYSIYTYRYFIHNWPKLCFLAMDEEKCVGAVVCKLDLHKNILRRGYIAMLAVDEKYRKQKIGSNLVLKAIRAMVADDADEVVLETEITNKPALRLYENLGFVRDKRLFRYYLNGVDALRLKLWLR